MASEIWMTSRVAKPDTGSTPEHGWETISTKLIPVFFKCFICHAQKEVATFPIVHAVRTVCDAQSCVHAMTMKTVETHIQLATKM